MIMHLYFTEHSTIVLYIAYYFTN